MNKPMLITGALYALMFTYYLIKPVMPKRLRYALRRQVAKRVRRRSKDSWPIKAGTEAPPENWSGWPEGKQFAFVLTHDVESPAGLEQCRTLMGLEERLGFRSSFNLVPEGSYTVPPALREEMERRGFEVGIHDLRHDGSLFRSRDAFRANAEQINRYVSEWGVQGFRAGFMFHRLQWQRDLKVRYDSSTFDVDPFEPQPDGVNTIFPFWVEGDEAGGAGYMELPYTLAQDSTVFLLFRERTIDLWKRKLDWVAEHGGLVLVNTHPDYMAFGNDDYGWERYPAALYEELLTYVRTRYAGLYWHALPRDVADHCARSRPHRPAPPPKQVCMITHSFYERDNRVVRYAEALAKRGDHVEVFALRGKPDLPRSEEINGVKVIRVQDRFDKSEQSKWSYLWPLLSFLIAAAWRVSRHHWHRPYQVVHVHNIPDFMVFAAWLPRLSGARIILDVHDIVPEFFGSKFGVSERSALIRALKLMERVSAAFAHHVILANHLWVDRYVARSAPREKCSVFINNVDRTVFRPVPRTRSGDRRIVIFPGGLQWHQGLDIAIRAFDLVHRQLPNTEFHIYGDGSMKPELIHLVRELGLDDAVRFHDPRPLREIAAVMADADLGVVPKRADSFGNEAYSTKIMEFMSVGVPVVISSTRIDRFYFNDQVVRFFQSGNVPELASAMQDLLTNERIRQDLASRAMAYAEEHSWENRKHDYLLLVDSLCEARA